jgi:hypothetical protein
MSLKQALKNFPIGCYIVLGFGLLLACGGGFLLALATPSPHGYIEIIFAIPAICFGLLIVAVSLLLGYKYINWPLKVLAVILLLVALYPILVLFLFG